MAESTTGEDDELCVPLEIPDDKKYGCANEVCLATQIGLHYVTGANEAPFECWLANDERCPDNLQGVGDIKLTREFGDWYIYLIFESTYLLSDSNKQNPEEFFRGGAIVYRFTDVSGKHMFHQNTIDLRFSDLIEYRWGRLRVGTNKLFQDVFYDVGKPKDIECEGMDLTGICPCTYVTDVEYDVLVAAALP